VHLRQQHVLRSIRLLEIGTWPQPMGRIQSTILAQLQSVYFPYFISFVGRSIHPHTFFESLGYVTSFAIFLFLRSRQAGDVVPYPLRWATLAAAFAGGTIGSKLLYWLEDPQVTLQHLRDPTYLVGGKSIVGALLGGLFAVEAMKRYINLRQSTGDLLAIPVAAGLAVGRIGCFLTGLSDNTYGAPTSLPWGVDFGDGIRRHPTQLYEIVFLIILIAALAHIRQLTSMPTKDAHRPGTLFRPGDSFKVFMVSYLAFRLFCDFIKPYPVVAFGLGSIQWACVAGLLYYSRDVLRWAKLLPNGER
jgi:phosphatidylglycerol---prolipoprotein diacylglyceryl transferase